MGGRVIRSHRREEPGRRTAFRVLTAMIISGSGLGVAMITAGGSDAPSSPVRTSDDVSRSYPRLPDDLETNLALPAPTTASVPTTAPAPTSSAAPSTTQPRLAARGSGAGFIAGAGARPDNYAANYAEPDANDTVAANRGA